MDKLIKPGRVIFALGIIALGILSIISKDFIVGRPPVAAWAATISGKAAWAYISGSLLIILGLAVIFEIRPKFASLFIGAMILLVSFFLRHQYEMSDWLNAFKTLALSGGAFIVAASFSKKEIGNTGNFQAKDKLVFTGIIFLSLFLIACGISHFKFAQFVKDFIPAYIPFHGFWTYFCGICLLAGGIGLIIPQIDKWAALLSGLMIGGWFILLHIPRVIMDTTNIGDRLGLCESFTLTGVFFVLAGILSTKR